jgi:putative redox protein
MTAEKGSEGCESCAFERSVSCEHLEGYQVLVRTEHHAWTVDEPPGAGGDGLAPNPYDMLLASLGSCTVVTVWYIASKMKTPIEKLWVDLEISSTGHGKERRHSIRMVLRVRGRLDEKDLEKIRGYADSCPIHRLLSKAARIETEIRLV